MSVAACDCSERKAHLSRLKLEGVRYLDRGPIDLNLSPGERVAVSGPSGAGKSLLLRAVADLIPWEGRIFLDSEECSSIPAPLWRCQVGLMPAESQWWADSVGEHLGRSAEGGSGQGPVESSRDGLGKDGHSEPGRERLRRLESLGFGPDVLDWEIRRLSTGEKQRLALVRLLGNSPRALLLDEPTASLDRENIRRVEEMLEAYCAGNGAPALWVSHDPDQARRICSRGYRFTSGRLEQEF